MFLREHYGILQYDTKIENENPVVSVSDSKIQNRMVHRTNRCQTLLLGIETKTFTTIEAKASLKSKTIEPESGP